MKGTGPASAVRVGHLVCYVWDGGSTFFFAYGEGGRMGRLFSTPSRERVHEHLAAVQRAFEPSSPVTHRAPGGEPANIVPRDRPEPAWRELAGFLDTDETAT